MQIKTNVLVIGSGAGGLGAAAWLKERGIEFCVVDAAEQLPMNMHNGVHYLHTIPELPFDAKIKKITLTDGVLLKNGEISPIATLNHALEYSEKVREIQHPSSIMEVGKDDSAYMPEDNSLNNLMKQMHDYSSQERFYFGWHLFMVNNGTRTAYFKNKNGDTLDAVFDVIISTAPLNKIGDIFGLANIPDMKSNPVYITNYKVERIVPNWMINLYIPDIGSPIYRASILNGVCSVESIRPLTDIEMKQIVPSTLSMFYLSREAPEEAHWPTGKVMSISIDDREKIVEELKNKNIYSIGRFGLWNRKLLVDSTINQAKAVVDALPDIDLIDWEDCKKMLIK